MAVTSRNVVVMAELTPNPNAIYLMPFIDTTAEPIVLEIPAAEGGSITGSVDDAWQTAVEDVGLAGVDQGQGGRYLILPPGYEGEVPDGYIAMPAATRRTYALLRSNLSGGSEADVAAALAYGQRVKLRWTWNAATSSRTSSNWRIKGPSVNHSSSSVSHIATEPRSVLPTRDRRQSR